MAALFAAACDGGNADTGGDAGLGTPHTLERSTTDTLAFEGTTERTEHSARVDSVATLTAVRAARHAGAFDRIAFEFADAVPSYTIEYPDVRPAACGSGLPVAIPAEAFLTVQLRPAQAHHPVAGRGMQAAERDAVHLAAVDTLVMTCDYEGVVGWAVAMDRRHPYRVLTLDNPPRLVIDFRLDTTRTP